MGRTPAVDRGMLTLGRRLGRGGQGSVHEVAHRKINKADGGGWDVVYKEYGADTLPHLDAAALASRVDLLARLTAADSRWLCETTAWPAAVVESRGHACGFLMRAVPERFGFDFRGLTATTGTRRLANLEYLLNDDAYVAGIGLAVSDRDRFELLIDLAGTLARLHRIGITVGDLSPKNLLFTTEPRPECFLIDCDAMLVGGTTVLPHVETPDWQLPAGERKATWAGDAYKFTLLALRLLGRDQSATDPAVLAARCPALVDVTRLGLDPNPARRPTPALWAEHLAVACTTASTTAPPPTPSQIRQPSVPPTAHLGMGHPPPNAPTTGGPGPLGTMPAKIGAGIAAAVAVVILALSLPHSEGASDNASDTRPQTTVPAGQYTPRPAPLPTYPQYPQYPATPTRPAAVPDDQPATPPAEPSASPTATATPDAIGEAEVGSCFDDKGTSTHPDLVSTTYTSGVFKVVRIARGTTDLDSCQNVTDNDVRVVETQQPRAVPELPASERHRLPRPGRGLRLRPQQRILLERVALPDRELQGPGGLPGHHRHLEMQLLAEQQPLEDVHRLLRHRPERAPVPVDQLSRRPRPRRGPHVPAKVRHRCPSDLHQRRLLRRLERRGHRTHRRPRNAAFCGRDGSAYWDSPEYPALSYTVCWRWLWNGAGGDRSSGPGRLGRPARNRGTSRVVRCHTIGHETPGNAVVRKDNPSQETSACGAPQTAVQISERARPSGSSATRTTTARGWGQKEKGAG